MYGVQGTREGGVVMRVDHKYNSASLWIPQTVTCAADSGSLYINFVLSELTPSQFAKWRASAVGRQSLPICWCPWAYSPSLQGSSLTNR